MKKGISLGIVLCMLLMLMNGAIPVFAEGEASTGLLEFVSATTTTTDPLPEGVVEQYECKANGSYPKADGSDTEPADGVRMSLEYITDADLTFDYDLGNTSVSGMKLYLGTPGDTEGTTITAYKAVEGGEPVELGSMTIDISWYYWAYIKYYLPFEEDLTGSGTLILSISNDEATNPDGWIGFSGYNFIDAGVTFDAFAETWRSDIQIAGPDFGDDLNGLGYSWFGDGDKGDYMINPNVDFGDTVALGVQLDMVTPGAEEVGENASIKIYSDGEEVLSAGADDIKNYSKGWRYVSFTLDKPINGGMHDITIKFSNIFASGGSNLGSFRFIAAKDGTQRILAVDYDNELDGAKRENEDGMEYTVGWFGRYYPPENRYGEELVYNYVDFGDKEMLSMNIRFNAWADADDESKDGNGILEVYADENLIGTVTNAELNANMNVFTTYTVYFDEPLTGVHDISIKSYWQGALSWLQFNAAKDGTQRFMAADYDSESGNGLAIEPADGLDEVVRHFGYPEAGDKLTYNLVDFGEEAMLAVNVRLEVWNDGTKDNALEIREGSENGALIAKLAKEDVVGLNTYQTYAIPLEAPLTGAHDLCVIGYADGGALAWFEFVTADDMVDGTQRILATDYDSFDGSIANRAEEDGMEYTVGWFGYTTGESLVYNLIDFGDKAMKSMNIRFNAWSDADAESLAGDGKVEVYAGSKLLGTISFDQLNQNINSFTTYTVYFDEPLTGVNNIKVKSYWSGALSWIEFSEEGLNILAASAPTLEKATGNVSLTLNGVADAATVQVVFACYDADGRLINYAESQKVAADEVASSKTLEASFGAAIPDGATVKAFVWSAVEAMTTLTAPVDVL